MTLEIQSVPIVFTQGVDTKTDAKLIPQGALSVLENAVFTKTGILEKRHGYDVLARGIEGSGSSISAAKAIATFNDELLLFTGTTVYSWSAATEHWMSRGAVTSIVTDTIPVIRNGYTQASPDSVVLRGVRLTAWEDSRGGVRYSVQDVETGAVFVADAQAHASATKPRVVAFGGDLVLCYAVAGALYYRRIPAVYPTTIAVEVQVVSTLVVAANNYDVLVVGARIFLAWNSTTGPDTLISYIDASFALFGTPVTFGVVSTSFVSLFADDTQNVYATLAATTSVYAIGVSYNLVVTFMPSLFEAVGTTVTRGTGWVLAGVITLVYEIANATPSLVRLRTNTGTISTGIVGTAASFVRSVGLASRAWVYDGVAYLLATFDTTLQRTYFALDSSARVVARVNANNGGGLRSRTTLANVTADADGSRFEIATQIAGQLSSSTGTLFTLLGCSVAALDFDHERTFPVAKLRNNLIIGGGVVQAYDGVSVFESGFHQFPEGVVATPGAAASGSMGAGTYAYYVVYEWTDNFGQIHRSSPSLAISATAVATGSVSLSIPTLRLTARNGTARANVRVVVYRTAAGLTVPYRLNAIASPLFNDTTTDTVTYNDQATDASIVGNELLPTFGGVVESIAPPASSIVASFGNRVFLAGQADGNQLSYSTLAEPGAPVYFFDGFTIDVDPRGGDITALAVLDDKLVIFKRHAIFAMSGAGPTNTGAQDDFTEPSFITADAGCANPNSIAATSAGLLFQSTKGIYVLDRTLQAQYVGSNVEAFNDSPITGAQLVPDTNQVRFTVSDGSALVYDYLFGQWATFTGHESVDCDVWEDRFVFVKSDGRVFVESPTSYTDGPDAYVKLRIVTGWLSFAGLQNFQRIQRFAILGDYRGAHQLRVKVAHDYSSAYTQSAIVDATTLIGSATYGSGGAYGSGTPYGGDYVPYEFRCHVQRQKCTAMKVSIEDVQSSGYNEGCAINGITLLAGIKKGLNKIPASRSF